jgi:K+-sensing histidine kinase KdpD
LCEHGFDVNAQLRWRLLLALGAAAPIAAAAALLPLRSHVDSANMALVLVAVVVALAASGRRLPGAVAAISAALAFDFFYTRPYGSLTITRGRDVETAVLLLVVGLIVGELASRSHRHRLDADRSSADIARLHAVAELVSAGASPDQVVEAVRNELRDLLALKSVRYSSEMADKPRPRLDRDGEVIMAGMRWAVVHLGLPGKEVDLIVQGLGRPLGRFILVPTPGVPLAWDRRMVAVALADQVGAALIAHHAVG